MKLDGACRYPIILAAYPQWNCLGFSLSLCCFQIKDECPHGLLKCHLYNAGLAHSGHIAQNYHDSKNMFRY